MLNVSEYIIHLPEIHVFNRLGVTLAYDPEQMNLFGVNELTAEIFRNAGGKTVRRLGEVLAHRYSFDEVKEVLEQLIRLKLAVLVPADADFSPYDATPPHFPDKVAEIKVPPLSRLVLYISQECNLHCRYCFLRAKGEIRPKQMSEEIAKAAILLLFRESEAERNLRISFYGGEPLLGLSMLRRILPWIREMENRYDKNVRLALTTNGLLLDNETLDFLRTWNVEIAVSLDGNRESHDHNRIFADGNGSFSRVYPAWQKLHERDAGAGAVTVVRALSPSLADIALFLLESGVQTLVINPAINNAGELILELPEGTEEDAVSLYNRQLEDMTGILLEKGFLFRDPPPLWFLGIIKNLEMKESPTDFCGAGVTRMAVDADGNILPCDSFAGEHAMYMGHVLTQSTFRLQSPPAIIPAAHREKCRRCWGRRLCSGGCPYYSYKNNGDLNTPVEDQCRLLRHQFEIAMAVYSRLKTLKKTQTRQVSQEAAHAGV